MTLSTVLLFPLMGFGSSRLPRSTDGPPRAMLQASQDAIIGHAASNRTNVIEFWGMAYAQPPIGPLPFKAPQRYAKHETFNASNSVSPVDLYSTAQALPPLAVRKSYRVGGNRLGGLLAALDCPANSGRKMPFAEGGGIKFGCSTKYRASMVTPASSSSF